MNKEEILEAAWQEVGSLGTDAIHASWNKIESYAENMAIEFAEWINMNGYRICDKVFNTWENDYDIEREFTNHDLLKQFKKEQEK